MKFLCPRAATGFAALSLSLFPAQGLAAPKPLTQLESVLPGVAVANAAADTPSLLADTGYQQAWLASLNTAADAASSSPLSSRVVGPWNGRNNYVAVAWSAAQGCWVISLVLVSSRSGELLDPFSESRELAAALAANARWVMGTAPGGVWSRAATAFFSTVVANTGFTIVAKNYLPYSWTNNAFTKAAVIQRAIVLSQAYGLGNQVAEFEPTNNKKKREVGDATAGAGGNLTIIADFRPTPELREMLARNFHAEELGIEREEDVVESVDLSKRQMEWCPDYSLRNRMIHGWAPWNTNYHVGCNI